MGGVRVLQFKDTELEVDAAGDARIKTVGTVPSNIGITDKGVLFSSIPNTLTFLQVIEIDGSGAETFSTVPASGTAVPVAGTASSDPGSDPNKKGGGPGFYTTPDKQYTDPSVGDFYVIRFTASYDDPVSGPGTKTLKWRKGDGTGAVDSNDPNSANGSQPVVEDGDMVAWGGEAWSVIGTVNTTTVAQNLQSVTTRGKTTTIGLELIETELLSNDTVSTIQLGPTGTGDGVQNALSVGSIDFERFPALS